MLIIEKRLFIVEKTRIFVVYFPVYVIMICSLNIQIKGDVMMLNENSTYNTGEITNIFIFVILDTEFNHRAG